MAANTSPIFVATPRNSYITTGNTANTLFDGTQTVATVFTAGANGSKIETITLKDMGTNIGSVVRFFINNGSTPATASNNALINEITWATYTASQAAATAPTVINTNIYLPAGYKLNVSIGIAVGSGIMVSAQGGDF